MPYVNNYPEGRFCIVVNKTVVMTDILQRYKAEAEAKRLVVDAGQKSAIVMAYSKRVPGARVEISKWLRMVDSSVVNWTRGLPSMSELINTEISNGTKRL